MIVTFYSFKGGVGRSMALANIARWYQLQGLNVVMVDWDLEAPGLETYFTEDQAVVSAWRDRVGLMDLLALYRQDHASIQFPSRTPADSVKGDSPPARGEAGLGWAMVADDAAYLRSLLPPLKFSLIEIPAPADQTQAGKMRLLTAGWREGDRFPIYANAVQSFDWNEFYDQYNGHAYFEWLRRSLDDPEIADVVLIDSRTGVTEMGGVSTRQLADVVVVLAAPNRQNMQGSVQMTRTFNRPELLAQRGGRPINVVMVPSRIDVAATEVKKEFEDEFKTSVDEFVPASLRALKADFWELRIPYVNKFAFRERLSVGEKDGDPDLNYAYHSIATHTGWLAPEIERTRDVLAPQFNEIFGPERIRAATDFAAQFESRLAKIPRQDRGDVRELLLRLVEARADATEPDRSAPVMESRLRETFGSCIDDAIRVRLVRRDKVLREGDAALEIAEPEYLTDSRLATWIDDDRDFLVWRKRLRIFLEDWEKNRDPLSLMQGTALQESLRLSVQAGKLGLLPDEREFIRASKAAEDQRKSFQAESAPRPQVASEHAPISPKAAARMPTKSSPRMIMIGAGIAAVFLAIVGGWFAKSNSGRTDRTFADSLIAGQKHAADSNYQAAIVALSLARSLDPTSSDVVRFLAEAQVGAGQPENAIASLDTALMLPLADTARILSRRAQIRAANRDADGAARDLDRIPLSAMDIKTLRLRGELYEGVKAESSAVATYTLLVEKGDTAAGQVGLGRAYEGLKMRSAAIAAYRIAAATAKDPTIQTFAETRLKVLSPSSTISRPAVTPTVYLQVVTRADGLLVANAIDSSLKRINLKLERDSLGNFEVKSQLRSAAEIRYFSVGDESLAYGVQSAVAASLASKGIFQKVAPLFVRMSRDSVRRGQIEIWLAPLREISRP